MWEWGHRNRDEKNTFGDLPIKLQQQLSIVKHDTLVASLEIFQEVPPPCVIAIVNRLKHRLTMPGEYVILQNQLGHELFMINRGRVQVTLLGNDLQEKPICQIYEGQVFGEMAMLSDSKRRTANIVTLTFCEFHTLEFTSFDQIANEFEAFTEALQRISEERLKEFRKMHLQEQFTSHLLTTSSVTQTRIGLTSIASGASGRFFKPKVEDAARSISDVHSTNRSTRLRFTMRPSATACRSNRLATRSKTLNAAMAAAATHMHDSHAFSTNCEPITHCASSDVGQSSSLGATRSSDRCSGGCTSGAVGT